MSLVLRFTRGAEDDVNDAYQRYQQVQRGLGEKFLN